MMYPNDYTKHTTLISITIPTLNIHRQYIHVHVTIVKQKLVLFLAATKATRHHDYLPSPISIISRQTDKHCISLERHHTSLQQLLGLRFLHVASLSSCAD